MYDHYFDEVRKAAQLRNFRPSSATMYCYYLKWFFNDIYPLDPADASDEDIRDFLISKKNAGLSPETVNLYYSAIRFLFINVLRRPWDSQYIPRMKRDHFLPYVPTREEIIFLLDHADNLKYKSLFAVMYSAGLRLSEAVHLHYEDVDRRRKSIYVRESKSRGDRYTLLADNCLEILTEYWYKFGRPTDYLFPGRDPHAHITANSVEQAISRIKRNYEMNPNITCHSLRHAFASHLYEEGTDIHVIQALLGHQSIQSTEIYIHTSDKNLLGIVSPFDKFNEVDHEKN